MAADKTFTIGLTMAGAVSAGAYTAGVVDELVRALQAHDAAFERGETGHRVVLKVMSGASAGGISAALATLALAEKIDERKEAYHPVDRRRPDVPAASDDPAPQPYVHRLRRLHDMWVSGVGLYDHQPDGPYGARFGGGLLGTSDLRAGAPLLSLLDSGAIDAAVDSMLGDIRPGGVAHGFLASELELFLTTTNVNGLPYRANFSTGGGGGGHVMASHAGVRHFRATGLGSIGIPSAWLEMWRAEGVTLAFGPGARIDLRDRAARGEQADAWTLLRETALATGAFPGGLAARPMPTAAREIHFRDDKGLGGLPWPIDVDPALRPCPEWDDAQTADHIAVDGGVINNEPFEYARFTLRPKAGGTAQGWALAPNPRGEKEADRAVIMVDPFPDGPEFFEPDLQDPAQRAVAALIGPVIGALVSQARLKPAEIVAAASPDVRSRFMIAPSREDPQADGADAIAAGALGGFAGFFDEAFRRHDFVLGQHNCRRFLQNHFWLDPANPVFGGKDDGGRTKGGKRPVLCRAALDIPEIPQPAWPRMPAARLERTLRHMGWRTDEVVGKAAAQMLSGGQRMGFGVADSLFGIRTNLKRRIERAVEAALLARDQVLITLPGANDAQRRLAGTVLAELIDPAASDAAPEPEALRSLDGLVAGIRRRGDPDGDQPEPSGVEAVLRLLSDPRVEDRYRTAARRGLWRLRRTPLSWRQTISTGLV